jgi:hypothetical protein
VMVAKVKRYSVMARLSPRLRLDGKGRLECFQERWFRLSGSETRQTRTRSALPFP